MEIRTKGKIKEAYRICEVCGKLLPIEEFSKSYPRRCKACVAEHTRMVRERAKNGMKCDYKQGKTDWEQRRFELVKTAMLGLMAGHHTIYDADKLPSVAIKYADALIAELKKGVEE